jgi:Domain of unknown function (DUF4407)
MDTPFAPGLTDSEANPRTFGLPTRFLLRVAGIRAEDVVEYDERVLYVAIGFFICLYGVYGSAAFFALLSRTAAVHAGTLAVRVLVVTVVSILMASAFAMFDRTLVAQANADLRSLRRSDESFLHPVAQRTLKPFASRLCIALLISIFATQSIEILLFADDIRSQETSERLSVAESKLSASEQSQEKAQIAFLKLKSKYFNNAEAAAAAARPARRAQRGHCKPKSQCAKRTAASDSAYAQYEALGAGPLSPTSHYARTQSNLSGEIAELHTNPSRALSSGQGPLQDVAALYSYFGRHYLAFAYYLTVMVILITIDLAALLLKYFVGHDTEYERRLASRKRLRWAQTADTLKREAANARRTPEEEAEEQRYAAATRRERTRVRRESDQAELKALAAAYAQVTADGTLDESARYAAHERLGKGLRYHGASYRPGRDTEDGYATDGSVAVEDLAPEDAHGAMPDNNSHIHAPADQGTRFSVSRSLMFELLGAAAGISLLVYLLGGIYEYGQLQQASLPISVMSDISTRTIIANGIVIALIGLPLIFGLSQPLEAIFARLQRIFGVPDFHFSDVRAFLTVAWKLAIDRLRSLLGISKQPQEWERDDPQATAEEEEEEEEEQQEAVVAAAATGDADADSKLTLRSPEVVGSTIAATALVGASELTDSAVAAIAAGVGLGTILFALLLLVPLGLIKPHSRGFHGWVVGIAALGTVFGAYVIAQYQPFKLPDATVKLITNGPCLEGRFLNQDANNAYLVDGREHTLRLIPMRAIAGIVVHPRSEPVSSASVHDVPCPSSVQRLSP